MINEILLEVINYIEFNDILFKDNILILNEKYKIFIISFSDDFKTNKLFTLNLSINDEETIFMLKAFEDITIFCLNSRLLKTSLDNYVLINAKIFEVNLKKYLDNDLDSKNGTDNLRLINPEFNIIINSDYAYYKEKNTICKGIIYVYYFFPNSHLNDFDNIKFGVIILKENLEQFLEIKFNIFNLKAQNNYILGLNYNYLNNTILVFLNSTIYQLNASTEELVTIYDSSIYISDFSDPYFNRYLFQQSYQIITYYIYNEKNKELETIFLIIDKITNKSYLFNMDKKCLVFKKEFNFINIKQIIPLFSIDILTELNKFEKNKEMYEKKYIEELLVNDDINLVLLN